MCKGGKQEELIAAEDRSVCNRVRRTPLCLNPIWAAYIFETRGVFACSPPIVGLIALIQIFLYILEHFV